MPLNLHLIFPVIMTVDIMLAAVPDAIPSIPNGYFPEFIPCHIGLTLQT